MSLKEYTKKRDLKLSPEPPAKRRKSKGVLKFFVQKHDASRLHYDLRLEMDGVLKSWAVPKGPSLDPDDKRLAIMVEDHPMDYGTFEGIIPRGNYGAGTVMLWDQGTYSASGVESRKEGEQKLMEGLRKGRISFILDGQKLRGGFSLFKIDRGGENEWLLVKKKDEFSSKGDVLESDASVKTGRSLGAIAEESENAGDVWEEDDSTEGEPDALLPAGDDKMPRRIRPMLATLVRDPFDRAGWIFEVKWDGYRTLAEIEGGQVSLSSRNQKSFDEKFAPIAVALRGMGADAVLDGEVMVVDERGRPQFQLLQNYQQTGEGNLIYYVFDILFLNGHILYEVPLAERKALLRRILPDLANVRFSDHIEETGRAFFDQVEAADLEGIIAKRADSTYQPGSRSRDWLKMKTHKRQEAVICGYSEPRGGRKHFGSLILGLYERDELVFIGQVGTGFSDALLRDLKARLEPLRQQESPFKVPPRTRTRAEWVRPDLVCEVTFTEWTDEGSLRHPVFVGLREDKNPKEVRREKPRSVTQVLPKNGTTPPSPEDRPPARTRKRVAKDEEQNWTIDGHKLKVTNLGKLYWPDEDIRKLDLIQYYRDVAPYILPHLKDRPESLHRHPNGISGESFFHKNVGEMTPDWIETIRIFSESGDREMEYLLCQKEATLVYLANLGCIELNPWLSRTPSLDKPDFLVIDLDPLDVPFQQVVDVALVTAEVLDKAGLAGYGKTSGSKGIHVYVPLGARYSYDQSKQFAELLAAVIHSTLPKTTSLERSPSKRKKKVYVDYLQNRQAQTIAAPYCVRPRQGAPVSTPLAWDELSADLDPRDFTIYTIPDRLRSKGDIFEPVLHEAIDLETALDKISEAFS